jgi:hypothetical protein
VVLRRSWLAGERSESRCTREKIARFTCMLSRFFAARASPICDTFMAIARVLRCLRACVHLEKRPVQSGRGLESEMHKTKFHEPAFPVVDFIEMDSKRTVFNTSTPLGCSPTDVEKVFQKKGLMFEFQSSDPLLPSGFSMGIPYQ